jgi:uncharacterized membrane protein
MSVPRWVSPAGLVLTLFSLGVSIYLTYEHYNGNSSLACIGGSNACHQVLTSPEAVIFGLPVSLYGLAFFVAMVPAQLPRAWRSADPRLRYGRLAALGVGLAFILYLIYVEFFTLQTICPWCTSVHIATVLLFAVTAIGTALSLPELAEPADLEESPTTI